MRANPKTPEQLANELLGREYSELAPEEQRVLEHIAAGVVTVPDANERASLNASLGDRMADRVAAVGGSWGFIFSFTLILLAWMLINSRILTEIGIPAFDRYPYIFLNLMLSMLAAIQAPVIMMSQNRQSQKDRISARHDYEVNLRAQLENIHIQQRLERISEKLSHIERQLGIDEHQPQ